jgi:4-hydroxy-3-methylbut-2-enyl diphosphate reductase IspH
MRQSSTFLTKKLHITNELIHNPEVNDKLLAMNVNFIEKVADGTKDFSTIGDGDVVILPAFGASFEEMQLFNDRVRSLLVPEHNKGSHARTHAHMQREVGGIAQ